MSHDYRITAAGVTVTACDAPGYPGRNIPLSLLPDNRDPSIKPMSFPFSYGWFTFHNPRGSMHIVHPDGVTAFVATAPSNGFLYVRPNWTMWSRGELEDGLPKYIEEAGQRLSDPGFHLCSVSEVAATLKGDADSDIEGLETDEIDDGT
jgi:hypothetical protein